MEKVTSLEKESEELKAPIDEIEAKIAQQTEASSGVAAMHAVVPSAFTEIAEHVQRQIVFNESTKTSIAGLVREVQKHQECFQEVVRVLQNQEQHIAKNGIASEEMAQHINALIRENKDKTLLIASLMNETQAQSQVLRQHHVGQHVLADVIKQMMFQQPSQPQSQAVTLTGPTVTEVDDDQDLLNYLGGPSPHSGPPNGGTGHIVTKPHRAPKHKVTPKRKCVKRRNRYKKQMVK